MKITAQNLNLTWLSGMPRSGTTWLSQILASSPEVRLKFCPLFSYEFKNALTERSSAEDWEQLFVNVYKTKSEFLDQDYLRNKGLIPHFTNKNNSPQHLIIKSTRFHNLLPSILERNMRIQFIHIIRHPCATIHSWLTNKNEFPEGADPMLEWRSGGCRKTGTGEFWGFDDWKAVNIQALQLASLYPERFKIIRYKDLVLNTRERTQELFDFLNIKYEKQTDDFITLSHSKHDKNKRSVFKNPRINDDWITTLDPSIISACLNEIAGTELEQFL